MKSREDEYREMFMDEALESYDAMSRHLSELERTPNNKPVLDELFRLMHNLKSSARAMGHSTIGEVAHQLESLFGLVRDGERQFVGSLAAVVFNGLDTLGAMIRAAGANAKLPDAEGLLYNLERVIGGEEIELIAESETEEEASKKLELSDLVYIQVRKLDKLLNLVGELVIDRDRILTLAEELDSPALRATARHLFRISDDLQYSVMDARLVGVGTLLNKFPRVVRDVATTEGKEVELTMSGQDTQIDRNVLQVIADALLHLVRNAVSHGLGTSAERTAAGKNPVGQLSLLALTEREDVLIQVRDNGKGIDTEAVRKKAIERGLTTAAAASALSDQAVWAFLFEPGFSTAAQVTDISGRGVGLDVVKRALDSLGGQLRVDSVLGEGTTFTLVLPTSIAVKGALLVELAGRAYAVALMHTDTVLALQPAEFTVVGGLFVAHVQGQAVPVVPLAQLLLEEGNEPLPLAVKETLQGTQNVLIVNYNNRRLGLLVDKFLRQQSIVVKPLSKPLDHIDLFGGVTLLGSGQVCLVLDVPALTRLFLARRP